jgi:hypothetical protein
MKRAAKVTFSVVLASSLVLGPIQSWSDPSRITYAAESELKAFSGMNLKTFNIGGNSTIQVKDVLFQYGVSSKKVFFTIKVSNGSNGTIDFMDYWVYLKSKAGANYKLTAAASNPANAFVSAKSTKEFVYYAEVGANVNYTDLKIELVKWDFNATNYEIKIGEASITSNYVNVVPADRYYIINRSGEKVKTNIVSAYSINKGDEKEVQIKFNLTNQSSNSITSNYKYYLRTKSGLIIKLDEAEQSDGTIGVNETEQKLLVAKVKTDIPLTGAQLLMTKVEKEEQEVPVAQYALTWNDIKLFLVQPNKARKTTIDNTVIESYVTEVFANQGDTTNDVYISLKYVNKGNKEITLPKYSYKIKTSNGKMYTVTSNDEAIVLQPDSEKEVSLNVVIPAVYKSNLTLFIDQPKSETTAEYAISAFKLSAVEPVKEVDSKIYKNAAGTYQFNIDSIERIPWGEEDILNVYVRIKNTGSNSAAIPTLSGNIALNGVDVKSDISWVKMDSQIMIEPNQVTSYVVSLKVPYTYTFNKINLEVENIISEDRKQTVGNFTSTKLQTIPLKNMSSSYMIDSVGRNSKVSVERMHIFEGNDSNLLYVDLGMTNEELRAKPLPALKAYFRTNDNEVYDAVILDVEDRVNPKAAASVTVTAVVPKTLESEEGLVLIIGEAMKGTTYANTSKEATGVIHAKGFTLEQTTTTISTDLRNIQLPAHLLDIRRIETSVSGSENVEITMNYSLQNEFKFVNDDKDRNLIFEIETTSSKHEKVVPIGKSGMTQGDFQSYSVSFSGSSLTSQIVNGYTLNVYEEFDGYKRLVGTKRVTSYSS